MGELAVIEVWDDKRCEDWVADFQARANEALRTGQWVEFSQANISSAIPQPVKDYIDRKMLSRLQARPSYHDDEYERNKAHDKATAMGGVALPQEIEVVSAGA